MHLPPSREQRRRFLHREDFLLPHQIIFHSMCNNVWKNIWSPQNELGVEW